MDKKIATLRLIALCAQFLPGAVAAQASVDPVPRSYFEAVLDQKEMLWARRDGAASSAHVSTPTRSALASAPAREQRRPHRAPPSYLYRQGEARRYPYYV